MMIIMIGGKARVGKTTLATWFSKYLFERGFSPVSLSFASILKEQVENTGLTKELNPVEYRLACQTLGSNKRKEDPDYWLRLFELKLDAIKKIDIANLESDQRNWHEKCVIVDDCRYLNEVGYGRKVDALQIFIAHGERKLEDHTGSWRKHESETMANKIETKEVDYNELFHYRLSNSTTEAEFKERISHLFDSWLQYLQSDEKKLCDCVVCVAARKDILYDNSEILEDLSRVIENYIQKEIEQEEEDDETYD